MMGDMTAWMVLGLLLIAVLIGAAIYLAVRTGIEDGRRGNSPRSILRERLAAGEISVAEYRERESALADPSPSTPHRDGRDT